MTADNLTKDQVSFEWRKFSESVPKNGSTIWWARKTGSVTLVPSASDFCSEDDGYWKYPNVPFHPELQP